MDTDRETSIEEPLMSQQDSSIAGKDPERLTLNEVFKKYKWKFFFALFTLGLVNNNGYVMVAAGADTLASDFDK